MVPGTWLCQLKNHAGLRRQDKKKLESRKRRPELEHPRSQISLLLTMRCPRFKGVFESLSQDELDFQATAKNL